MKPKLDSYYKPPFHVDDPTPEKFSKASVRDSAGISLVTDISASAAEVIVYAMNAAYPARKHSSRKARKP